MKRQLTGLLQNAWPKATGRFRSPLVRLDVSGRSERAPVFRWGVLGVAGRFSQPKGRPVFATELTVDQLLVCSPLWKGSDAIKGQLTPARQNA